MFEENRIHDIRWNIYSLVKTGFSREECYNMPIGEFSEYIRIINREIEKQEEADNSNAYDFDPADNIKMAGNTLPN